jgi:hypothetical protein
MSFVVPLSFHIIACCTHEQQKGTRELKFAQIWQQKRSAQLSSRTNDDLKTKGWYVFWCHIRPSLLSSTPTLRTKDKGCYNHLKRVLRLLVQ